MTTTTTPSARPHGARSDRMGAALFSSLTGLTAVAVLLQGLWAGIFLEHDGQRDAAESWIDVHATGGEVAIVLSVLATVVAFWKLRSRRELCIGGAALVVLLVLEAWIGGQIRDEGRDTLTAVHVPLAMALMALVVWLPLRASRAPRG